MSSAHSPTPEPEARDPAAPPYRVATRDGRPGRRAGDQAAVQPQIPCGTPGIQRTVSLACSDEVVLVVAEVPGIAHPYRGGRRRLHTNSDGRLVLPMPVAERPRARPASTNPAAEEG
jgi:hypothetical protein